MSTEIPVVFSKYYNFFIASPTGKLRFIYETEERQSNTLDAVTVLRGHIETMRGIKVCDAIGVKVSINNMYYTVIFPTSKLPSWLFTWRDRRWRRERRGKRERFRR